jgi:hypothetical protein
MMADIESNATADRMSFLRPLNPDQAQRRERQESRVYLAFGLRIRSSIALPEIPAGPEDGSLDDVTITTGRIAERLEGAVVLDAFMQVSLGAFQFNSPAGRYFVRDGRRIVVDARPGASARDVRLYLLGTVMAALCHQRSLLPLHATSVELGGDAVAFAGGSGAGKSTIAAQFHARGRTVLADDLSPAELGAGRPPMLWPGLQRIKIWTDSLALAGHAGADLPRIADGVDKVSLPVTPAAAHPRRLRQIYVLQPRDSGPVRIDRLSGPEAVAAVFDNVHRWPLAVAMGRAPAEFNQVLTIVANCEIFTLKFRHDPAAPLSAVERIEEIWKI